MTTQAQIELAVWEVLTEWRAEMHDNVKHSLARRIAERIGHFLDRPTAALIAAAEVGEEDELESGVLLTKAIDEVIAEDIEKERLQELVSQGIQIERQLRKELLTLRADTIERCAQVVDGFEGTDDVLPRQIAAEIRALKDIKE